jgi:hypothetical protein
MSLFDQGHAHNSLIFMSLSEGLYAMSISGISLTPSIGHPQPTSTTNQVGTQAQGDMTSKTLADQQTASAQQSGQAHHHHGGKHVAAQPADAAQSGTAATGVDIFA